MAIWLILAAAAIAITLALTFRVRVDPEGTTLFNLSAAVMLFTSRRWWNVHGHQRIADVCGTIAVAGLGGLMCGAVAMLELRLRLPIADGMLQSFDHALGVDGLSIVEGLLRRGHWIFNIMAPAYNYTLHIFFAGLIALSLLGDRVEAWRAALCFVGTLLTTCLISMFVPAKGLAVWASDPLLARLPDVAMRSFWPRFDAFYYGADPVLKLQVIDGVISFPSFHAQVGFLTLAMWRKNIVTFAAAGVYLAFMLLSIFPGGGHYFVDLLGGFVVWLAWFALSRRIEHKAVPRMALVKG